MFGSPWMNGENWMNSSSVFVTGGTVYLGQRLIQELLTRGHRVRALTRPGSEGRLPPNCVTVLGDALDPASYQNQIHLIGACSWPFHGCNRGHLEPERTQCTAAPRCRERFRRFRYRRHVISLGIRAIRRLRFTRVARSPSRFCPHPSSGSTSKMKPTKRARPVNRLTEPFHSCTFPRKTFLVHFFAQPRL